MGRNDSCPCGSGGKYIVVAEEQHRCNVSVIRIINGRFEWTCKGLKKHRLESLFPYFSLIKFC
ncbi:SEC-C metal-binding domain-containing protein [Cytobacillus kochii]|uniref:SEC-C metal-binding domain-containing protein n=1 Tax=Cytobacillus kochii TaxID=859143 RepID=UPI00399CA9FC